MIAFIGIGNSDDKLSQRQWVCFQLDVRQQLSDMESNIIGEWHSYEDSIFQNACFAVEIEDDKAPELKGALAAIATIYEQDAIAWNPAPATEFLGPDKNASNTAKWAGHVEELAGKSDTEVRPL